VINVIKSWIRPAARRAEALILMYHRIGDPGCDPWRLAVRPERFAEHLDVLRRSARPMGLSRLAQKLGEGTLKPGAVAVTFDDGYANNLYEAKPLLEHHEVPATVFVTSGMVGHDREFWWDELEAMLLAPRKLPQTLRLEIEGETHEWGPIDSARNFLRQRRIEKEDVRKGQPCSREDFYYSVWTKLQPLRPSAREKALDEIRAWAGNFHGVRDSHRPLKGKKSWRANGGLTISLGDRSIRLRIRMGTIRTPRQPWSHRLASNWPALHKRRRFWTETIPLNYDAFRFVIGTAVDSHAAWPKALGGTILAEPLF
jgi:Polysaccharide deacetylase